MAILFFILAFVTNTWASDAHERTVEIPTAQPTTTVISAALQPTTTVTSETLQSPPHPNYGSTNAHGASDLLNSSASSALSASLASVVVPTPTNPTDYTPKSHPVLSRSNLAKRYVKCSTICCFFCKGWFRTGSFVAGVASTAVAGVAYGITDPYYKDKLGLALVLLTFSATALRKFEEYAAEEVQNDEDQYGMFVDETGDQKK